MQNEKEIRREIEALRKKLNEEVNTSDNRVPSSEMLELSQKMDELLNNLAAITNN